jgi:hypothetical protein
MSVENVAATTAAGTESGFAPGRVRRVACLLAAAVTMLAALGWQALTVHVNYRGDWSALFYTGDGTRVPPAIADEGVYTFPDSQGYDAQYYHFIAHDPWLRRGFAPFVDNPRMRWHRILLPGLASLAGDDYVDSLYCVLLLACVFAGAYWLAAWCVECGYRPRWGVAFLLLPATLISLDRATVDVALAALTVAFALYRGRALWVVLAVAPLARETGLLLTAANAACSARERHWRAVGWSAAALLPCALWWAYVAQATAPDLTSHLAPVPFGGIWYRLTHPVMYETSSAWLRKAAALDYIGFLGACAAIALAVVAALRTKGGRLEIAALAFAAALVFVGQPQVWAEAYAFGRVAAPLLLLLALVAVRDRWWWGLAPVAMVLPRVLWQLAPQFKAVLRGL